MPQAGRGVKQGGLQGRVLRTGYLVPGTWTGGLAPGMRRRSLSAL